MKSYLFILSLFTHFLASAATYYVKSAGGVGSGLSESDAWSFPKFLAMTGSLSPGDKVLFKRGDVFNGTISVSSGGAFGRPITFDAYGSGNNPLISGLTEVLSWKLYSKNIYYANVNVPNLNLVTLNGVVQKMGRYPNTGYLRYTSHTGNKSISGSTIGTIPFDPTDNEIVIRKARWVLDRHTIESRKGNTIYYRSGSSYEHSDLYNPVNGNGYFLQGGIGTLDKQGEWYYDTLLHRLYMCFGEETSANKNVKVSTSSQNLYINYFGYLNFNNITFEGGNMYGAYIVGTSHIAFRDCIFRQQGGNGIWSSYISYLSVKGGSVTDALNNGIFIERSGDSITLDGIAIRNAGAIAGAGRSGDGGYEGVCIVGDRILIENCSVTNVGYIGINFQGNNVLIQNNVIDSYGNVKDDGAGIYTYTGEELTNSNRIIRKNVVLNSLGAFAGAEANYWEAYGKAAGIYLDDYANHVKVDSNVIAHGSWAGIFLHNAHTTSITGNLVYDFARQLELSQDKNSGIRNNIIFGNTFVARTDMQSAMRLYSNVPDNVKSFGTFNNNVYARPLDDDSTITIDYDYKGGLGSKSITLSAWKLLSGRDELSSKSAITTHDVNDIFFDYSTSQKKNVEAAGPWKKVSGSKFLMKISLEPFEGTVIIHDTIEY